MEADPSGLHRAERAAIARSLAATAPGAPAPWTVVATDAVGSARFVGEVEAGCGLVEVLRLRADRLDTITTHVCREGRAGG